MEPQRPMAGDGNRNGAPEPDLEQVQPAPPLEIVYRPINCLRVNPRNARTHSKGQVRQLADIIRAVGFRTPVVVDENDILLAGHGRLQAAQLVGMAEVPVVRASGLTEVQKRAFVLADNRLAEKAGWDRGVLTAELGELALLLPQVDLDLTITGFEPPALDTLFADRGPEKRDPADELPAPQSHTCTRRGDLWLLGGHRLLCGDARSADDLGRLMAGQRAHVVFTDPPYNLPIHGHVQGRSRVQHPEFAFASGEMDRQEYRTFLRQSVGQIPRASRDGAIAFVCMDWRHLADLQAVGEEVFTEIKNLIVWNKTSPGQGSFYRSQHELILVFKVGRAEHRNSFGLGSHGRMRSNVWTYPGMSSFRAGRNDELAMHPTVKPMALVADALRDCSIVGDLALDIFMGSGTTLLAAEKIGRISFGLEYEPRYVDVAIRRWQAYTKGEAVLEADGRTFDEVRRERQASTSAP